MNNTIQNPRAELSPEENRKRLLDQLRIVLHNEIHGRKGQRTLFRDALMLITGYTERRCSEITRKVFG